MSDHSERIRDLVEALVGPRSGIVQSIREVPSIDGDAPLRYFGARIANTHPNLSARAGLACGGAGSNRESAILAVLGEAVERYAASDYCHERLLLLPMRGIDGPCIEPSQCVQFTASQRAGAASNYCSPTADTRLRWARGQYLGDGGDCHVPAFATYVPYLPGPDEPLLGPSVSTGLCCAESQTKAIIGAALEVIERDAVALTWLKGMTPPEIDSATVQAWAGGLLPPRDEVHAYDLTTDVGLPIVLVVCRGAGPRGEIISVGSACRMSAGEALRKAATEASQDRVYVRMLIDRDPDFDPGPRFTRVTDFSLHARLYSGRSGLADKAFSFLDAAPLVTPADETVSIAEDAAVARVKAALDQRNLRAAWIDLTPEGAHSLGLHVVKVLIPDLLPLHGHHYLAYLGHPRLRASHVLPRSEKRHAYSIWPFPHPFP